MRLSPQVYNGEIRYHSQSCDGDFRAQTKVKQYIRAKVRHYSGGCFYKRLAFVSIRRSHLSRWVGIIQSFEGLKRTQRQRKDNLLFLLVLGHLSSACQTLEVLVLGYLDME